MSLKRWVTGLSGFVAAVLLAGIGILVFQDHSEYQRQVAEAFRLMTGRALVVEGDIRMRIGLNPTLIMEDVSLANAKWGSKPHMASFRHFEASFDLMSLLDGEFRIKRITLISGEVFLERGKDGEGNWSFVDGTDSATETPSPLAHTAYRVHDAKIFYRESATVSAKRVDIDWMSSKPRNRGKDLALALTGRFEGRALAISGSVGSGLIYDSMPLTAAVDLNGQLGGTNLVARGTLGLPFEAHKTDLKFTLEGAKVRASLAALKIDSDISDSYRIHGRLNVKDGRWVFSELKARIGPIDVAGRVEVPRNDAGAPIDVELSLPKIDLSRKAPGSNRKAKLKSKWVFGPEALPYDRIPDVNVRFKISTATMSIGKYTLRDANFSGRLDNRVLIIRRLKAKFLGGIARGGFVLNGSRPEGRIGARLRFKGIDIGKFLSTAGVTDSVSSRGDVSVNLAGSGRTWRDVARGMNGSFEIVGGRGQVRGTYVDLLGADLLGTIAPWASSIKDASVNCMVSFFHVRKGVATNDGLLFDTSRVTVAGKGRIDFRSEKYDMRLMPRPKDPSLLSLASPIVVEGPLNSPNLYPDELNVARNIAEMVAGGFINPLIVLVPLVSTGSGDGNPCVAVLEKKRGKDWRKKLPEYDDRSFIFRTIGDIGDGIESGFKDIFGE